MAYFDKFPLYRILDRVQYVLHEDLVLLEAKQSAKPQPRAIHEAPNISPKNAF